MCGVPRWGAMVCPHSHSQFDTSTEVGGPQWMIGIAWATAFFTELREKKAEWNSHGFGHRKWLKVVKQRGLCMFFVAGETHSTCPNRYGSKRK